MISHFQNAGLRSTQIVTNALTHESKSVLSRKASACFFSAKAFWEINKRLKIRIWASDAGKQKVVKHLEMLF